MGFKEGAAEGNPVLLEPIMKVEVVTPEDYMGDVMGDLNRRRGMMQGMEESFWWSKVIRARCRWPRCSAMRPTCAPTQGRATYSMEFEKYAEAPPTSPKPSSRKSKADSAL
jgi:elongation factor G